MIPLVCFMIVPFLSGDFHEGIAAGDEVRAVRQHRDS